MKKMKKVVLLLSSLIIASMCTFGQATKSKKLTYKLGLATSIPTDTYGSNARIGLGSVLADVSYKYSTKVDVTVTAGFLRYIHAGSTYNQIPLLAGVRYTINDLFYFGGSIGFATYTSKEDGTLNALYAPYVGLRVKRISMDVRYYATIKTNPVKTLGLVFYYSL